MSVGCLLRIDSLCMWARMYRYVDQALLLVLLITQRHILLVYCRPLRVPQARYIASLYSQFVHRPSTRYLRATAHRLVLSA